MPAAKDYFKRKLSGRCSRCGSKPAEDGLVSCRICRDVIKKRARVQVDQIEARIGIRSTMPEWKIREREQEQQRVREIREIINA